jgi:hypothetical protein
MTDLEFTLVLQKLGLSQAGLGRLLVELGERQPAATTVWRWADGRTRVPVGIGALLRLLERMPQDQRSRLLGKVVP